MSQPWSVPESGETPRSPRHAASAASETVPRTAISPYPLPPPVEAPGSPQAAPAPPVPSAVPAPPPPLPDEAPAPPLLPYSQPMPAGYLPRVPQVGAPGREQPARRDWRSGLRRGLTQLAGVSTSRDSREYVQLHRRLTTAVTSGRRILVLSIEPAQGSTTVAALLATALATRRADPVLLVDAAAISVNPLHHVLQTRPARTIRDLAQRPPEITSRAGFDDQLTPVGRDVWLLPGDEIVGRSGLHAPDAPTYTAAVTPFGRYFDITITDLGCSPGYGTAELLLDRAHALCLITSATRAGFDAVTSRLRQLRDTMATPWAGRTLVVANRPRPGHSGHWPGRSSLRRAGGVPVVQLAYDPGLAPGFPGRLAQLTPETHLAALRLAAGVIDTAVPR